MMDPEIPEIEEVPSLLLPCASCNRTFRPEALAKHTKVCEKSLMKKRKQFDSSKQRLQGTEIENFASPAIAKTHRKKETQINPNKAKVKEKLDLGKTIQAMKKPIESTSVTHVKPSDHEECPYCGRSFGPKAFERHTEFCKEQHQKLKLTPNVSNEAKERLKVRTTYRGPLTNRVLTRDRYQPARNRDSSPMTASCTELRDEGTKSKGLTRNASLRSSFRGRSSETVPPPPLRRTMTQINPRLRSSKDSINNEELLNQSSSSTRTSTANRPRLYSREPVEKKLTDSGSHRMKSFDVGNSSGSTKKQSTPSKAPFKLNDTSVNVFKGLSVFGMTTENISTKIMEPPTIVKENTINRSRLPRLMHPKSSISSSARDARYFKSVNHCSPPNINRQQQEILVKTSNGTIPLTETRKFNQISTYSLDVRQFENIVECEDNESNTKASMDADEDFQYNLSTNDSDSSLSLTQSVGKTYDRDIDNINLFNDGFTTSSLDCIDTASQRVGEPSNRNDNVPFDSHKTNISNNCTNSGKSVLTASSGHQTKYLCNNNRLNDAQNVFTPVHHQNNYVNITLYLQSNIQKNHTSNSNLSCNELVVKDIVEYSPQDSQENRGISSHFSNDKETNRNTKENFRYSLQNNLSQNIVTTQNYSVSDSFSHFMDNSCMGNEEVLHQGTIAIQMNPVDNIKISGQDKNTNYLNSSNIDTYELSPKQIDTLANRNNHTYSSASTSEEDSFMRDMKSEPNSLIDKLKGECLPLLIDQISLPLIPYTHVTDIHKNDLSGYKISDTCKYNPYIDNWKWHGCFGDSYHSTDSKHYLGKTTMEISGITCKTPSIHFRILPANTTVGVNSISRLNESTIIQSFFDKNNNEIHKHFWVNSNSLIVIYSRNFIKDSHKVSFLTMKIPTTVHKSYLNQRLNEVKFNSTHLFCNCYIVASSGVGGNEYSILLGPKDYNCFQDQNKNNIFLFKFQDIENVSNHICPKYSAFISAIRNDTFVNIFAHIQFFQKSISVIIAELQKISSQTRNVLEKNLFYNTSDVNKIKKHSIKQDSFGCINYIHKMFNEKLIVYFKEKYPNYGLNELFEELWLDINKVPKKYITILFKEASHCNNIPCTELFNNISVFSPQEFEERFKKRLDGIPQTYNYILSLNHSNIKQNVINELSEYFIESTCFNVSNVGINGLLINREKLFLRFGDCILYLAYLWRNRFTQLNQEIINIKWLFSNMIFNGIISSKYNSTLINKLGAVFRFMTPFEVIFISRYINSALNNNVLSLKSANSRNNFTDSKFLFDSPYFHSIMLIYISLKNTHFNLENSTHIQCDTWKLHTEVIKACLVKPHILEDITQFKFCFPITRPNSRCVNNTVELIFKTICSDFTCSSLSINLREGFDNFLFSVNNYTNVRVSINNRNVSNCKHNLQENEVEFFQDFKKICLQKNMVSRNTIFEKNSYNFIFTEKNSLSMKFVSYCTNIFPHIINIPWPKNSASHLLTLKHDKILATGCNTYMPVCGKLSTIKSSVPHYKGKVESDKHSLALEISQPNLSHSIYIYEEDSKLLTKCGKKYDFFTNFSTETKPVISSKVLDSGQNVSVSNISLYNNENNNLTNDISLQFPTYFESPNAYCKLEFSIDKDDSTEHIRMNDVHSSDISMGKVEVVLKSNNEFDVDDKDAEVYDPNNSMYLEQRIFEVAAEEYLEQISLENKHILNRANNPDTSGEVLCFSNLEHYNFLNSAFEINSTNKNNFGLPYNDCIGGSNNICNHSKLFSNESSHQIERDYKSWEEIALSNQFNCEKEVYRDSLDTFTLDSLEVGDSEHYGSILSEDESIYSDSLQGNMADILFWNDREECTYNGRQFPCNQSGPRISNKFIHGVDNSSNCSESSFCSCHTIKKDGFCKIHYLSDGDFQLQHNKLSTSQHNYNKNDSLMSNLAVKNINRYSSIEQSKETSNCSRPNKLPPIKVYKKVTKHTERIYENQDRVTSKFTKKEYFQQPSKKGLWSDKAGFERDSLVDEEISSSSDSSVSENTNNLVQEICYDHSFESIEYRQESDDFHTVKTSIHRLPFFKNSKLCSALKLPLINQPSVSKTAFKSSSRHSSSIEKLPPLVKHTRDAEKYNPYISAERQMMELFGGDDTTKVKPILPEIPLSPPIQSSPASAFVKYSPHKRTPSLESLKSDNKENNNDIIENTAEPVSPGEKIDNHRHFSLSNLSLCSVVSIDSIDGNKNTTNSKNINSSKLDEFQRSFSALESKSSRSYGKTKVNMQQMLYGSQSPEQTVHSESSSNSDTGNIEACEQELLISMLEFEKMLKSSPLPSIHSSPVMCSSSAANNINNSDIEIENKKNERNLTNSIDSAYSSLTRSCGAEGDINKQMELPKFCHECGSKYPVAMAKFCCNCGMRRITL